MWGDGLFQTKLEGNGVCVLESPVPVDEIVKYKLNNNKLCVNGDFALIRKGNINFKVELATGSIVGAFTSREGKLQTFQGTGEVWIAPTRPLFDHFNPSSNSGLLSNVLK